MVKLVPRTVATIVSLSLLALLLAGVIDVKVVSAQNVIWTRQFGSPSNDNAYGVSVYGSGVYVVGCTYDAMPGKTNLGGWDAFVRKYNVYGTLIWTRQFGTSSDDCALDVSVDSSGVYVAGWMNQKDDARTAFLRKYDVYGNPKWTQQIEPGEANGVCVYGSGVYVVGYIGQHDYADAFVRKYDVYGNLKWTRDIYLADWDEATAVSVDSSGVYVAGTTQTVDVPIRNPGNVFVRKYDFYGNLKWPRQFGSPDDDVASGVSAGGSGVYVVGWTYGAMPGKTSLGRADAFIRKYNAYGTLIWTRQFGSANQDYANGVCVYGSGVYVVGSISGNPFVRKYDFYGNVKWTRQLGTPCSVADVSVTSSAFYVAGTIGGAFPGQTNKGGSDAFVRKYAPP